MASRSHACNPVRVDSIKLFAMHASRKCVCSRKRETAEIHDNCYSYHTIHPLDFISTHLEFLKVHNQWINWCSKRSKMGLPRWPLLMYALSSWVKSKCHYKQVWPDKTKTNEALVLYDPDTVCRSLVSSTKVHPFQYLSGACSTSIEKCPREWRMVLPASLMRVDV